MTALACGVDIGGTKILAGVVDGDGLLVDEVRVDSPATNVDAIEDGVVAAVGALRAKHEIGSVGVGAAGYIDREGDEIYFAPNLAWRHERLGSALRKRLGLPVRVDNDGNAAAYGEYRLAADAAADGGVSDDFLFITVGTGIGGGIVTGGGLLRGAFGVAAEIGHMRVVPGGIPCGCGQRGCWEKYASGSALVRLVAETRPGEVPLTGPQITEAARNGDESALAAFHEVGRWLGEGIASMVAILDPGVVVIGGGVAEAGELLLTPAREAFASHLTGGGDRPSGQIRASTLGNKAGVIGAALLGAL